MSKKEFNIKAQSRTISGRKVKQLRNEGLIPAVVYGSGIDSTSITLDLKEFIKLYEEAGESTIIDLIIDDKKTPLKVLIKEIDIDYAKRRLLHASFYKVNMNEKITTVIPLEFIGEAPAEENDAVILNNFDEVEVTCLPKDLPDHLDVDITKLTEIGDTFTFSELLLPDGVELAIDEEEMELPIVTASAPVTEEEEAAKLAEGEAELEEVELTEQSEDEIEEGEEGVVQKEEKPEDKAE
jgi:large subunit ribosomal protein L25